MRDKTRQNEIDRILLAMALYYEHELALSSIDLYHALLADQEYQDINAACQVWMKGSRWFPKASEIIATIERNKGPQISIEARAQQQWRVVMAAVRQRGLNRGAPAFADGITANLVNTQFRWAYLCSVKENDENWEQKRWVEAFDLAGEIHQDLLQLDAGAKVNELVSKVAKFAIAPRHGSQGIVKKDACEPL